MKYFLWLFFIALILGKMTNEERSSNNVYPSSTLVDRAPTFPHSYTPASQNYLPSKQEASHKSGHNQPRKKRGDKEYSPNNFSNWPQNGLYSQTDWNRHQKESNIRFEEIMRNSKDNIDWEKLRRESSEQFERMAQNNVNNNRWNNSSGENNSTVFPPQSLSNSSPFKLNPWTNSGSSTNNNLQDYYNPSSTNITYSSNGTEYYTNDTYSTTGNPKVKRNMATRSRFLHSLGYDKVPEGYEVDHIVPLSQGGSDTPDNMQLLSHEEHRQKTARERANVSHTGFPSTYFSTPTLPLSNYSVPTTTLPNSSREIHTGPRGGEYYYNSNNNKTYIKKD